MAVAVRGQAFECPVQMCRRRTAASGRTWAGFLTCFLQPEVWGFVSDESPVSIVSINTCISLADSPHLLLQKPHILSGGSSLLCNVWVNPL